MATNPGAGFEVAINDRYMFSNAGLHDFIMRTTGTTQKIWIGHSNGGSNAALGVMSSNVAVYGSLGVDTSNPEGIVHVLSSNSPVIIGETFQDASGFSNFGKQLSLVGKYNSGYNTGNSIKLYIGNYDNEANPNNVYPIMCEDENGLVDFSIRARSTQAGRPTMFFAGYMGMSGNSNPTSDIAIGTSFATVRGITVDTAGTNGSSFVTRRGSTNPAFSILSWTDMTFLGLGTYYEGGSWKQHNNTSNAQLLGFHSDAVVWYASSGVSNTSNITGWNIANNIALWDTSAAWKSLVQSTRTGDSYFTGGRLGVGTSTPSTTIDVRGNAYFEHNTGKLYVNGIKGGESTYYNWAGAYIGQQLDYNTTSSNFIIKSDGANAGASGTLYTFNGGIRFFAATLPGRTTDCNVPYDQFGPAYTRMTIAANGNVGIGTIAPLTNFHVNHDLHIAANAAAWNTSAGKGLYMRYSTNGAQDSAYIQSISRASMLWQNMAFEASNIYMGPGTTSTSTLTLQYNGNVGVGTRTPAAKIDVWEDPWGSWDWRYDYPPAGMTANTTTFTNEVYANGTYVASASTSVFSPYLAFDYDDGGSWKSASGVYNSTTGAYTGAQSTTHTTGSITGEWLQIQLPFAITLQSFTLQCRNAGDGKPKNFSVLGSTNGTTWTLINSQTAQTFFMEQRKTYSVGDFNSYNYFRMVVNATTPNGNTDVTLWEWRIRSDLPSGQLASHLRILNNTVYVPRANVAIGYSNAPYQLTVVAPPSEDAYMALAAGGEDKNAILYLGTPFMGKPNFAFRTAIISEGIGMAADGDYGKNKLHLCLNTSTGASARASISDARLTIDTAGNVGIGTTTAIEKLQVVGNIHLGASNDDNQSYFIRSTGQLNIIADSTSADNNFVGLVLGAGSNTSTRQNFIQMQTAGKNSIFIGSNQNVGIQPNQSTYTFTAVPPQPLSVLGNGYFRDNLGIGTTAPTNRIHVDVGTATTGTAIKFTGSNRGYFVDFSHSNDGARALFGIDGVGYGNISTGATLMASWTNHPVIIATNGVERMRFDTAGNVGIGVTAPGSRLHVESSGTTQVKSTTTSTTSYADIGAGNSTSGTTRTRIGTLGTAYTTAGAFVANGGFLDTEASLSGGLSIAARHSTGGIIRLYTGGDADANERMRIDTSGNIGVGTTAPGARLDVQGTALLRNGNSSTTFTSDQLQFGWSSGTSYKHAIKTRHNNGADNFGNAIDFFLWQTTDAASAVGTKNMMSITSAGIGIRTSNPGYMLHVEDGSVFIGQAAFSNTGSTAYSGDRLWFDSTYNATAGTGTPANKIVLHANGANGFLGGFGVEFSAVTYHSGQNHTFYSGATTSGTYGTARMRLDGSGNLICTGDVSAFGTISDSNLKTDVVTLESCLDVVNQLRPVEFKWRDDLFQEDKRGKLDVGFLAQEVESVVPLAVGEYEHLNAGKTYKNLKHERLIPYLVGAVQDLTKKIQERDELISNLQKEVQDLRNIVLRNVP